MKVITLRVALAALILASVGVPCSPARPVFRLTQSVRVTTGTAGDFTAADFNGDGRRDFAVIDWLYGRVLTVPGAGPGTVGTPIVAAAIRYPIGIAAGDTNGDGIDDLIVVGRDEASANVMISNLDGTFTAVARYGSAMRPGLGLADLNDDGRMDLVTTPGRYLRVQLGEGSGSFGAGRDYECATNSGNILFADLNKDGHLDVITTDVGDDEVVTFLGEGDGRLQGARSFASRVVDTHQPVAGDFDRDGNLDVVVAGIYSEIEVQFGLGDGRLNRARTIYLGGDPRSVGAGDFDGDGLDDVVALDTRTGELKFLAGRGDGTFLAPEIYSTPRDDLDWSDHLLIDDFNRDGTPDVATLTHMGVLSLMSSVPEPGSLVWIGFACWMALRVPHRSAEDPVGGSRQLLIFVDRARPR